MKNETNIIQQLIAFASRGAMTYRLGAGGAPVATLLVAGGSHRGAVAVPQRMIAAAMAGTEPSIVDISHLFDRLIAQHY